MRIRQTTEIRRSSKGRRRRAEKRTNRFGVSCRLPLSRGPRDGAMVWSELVCGPFETVGPVVGAVSTPTPERRAGASLRQE